MATIAANSDSKIVQVTMATSTVLAWTAIQGWFKVKQKRGYISRETNRVI